MPATAKHKRPTRTRKKRISEPSPSPQSTSSPTSSSDSSDQPEKPAGNETHEAASSSIVAKKSQSRQTRQKQPSNSRNDPTVNPEHDSKPGASFQRPPSRAVREVADSAQHESASSKSDRDFEAWYLASITDELADDLDRIRQAADFKDSSVAALRTSLKQGVGLYSDQEKAGILRAASIRKLSNA